MIEFRNDDELSALLTGAYPTIPFELDYQAREQLAQALARDNIVAIGTATSQRAWRRRVSSHTSALVLGTISVFALSGVAAAAVVANNLPGFTRAVAYDLGLPVTSPALFEARQQLHSLVRANTTHHTGVARELGRGLLKDLKLLNHTDLSQIRTPAETALTQSGLLGQATKILGITTTTTTLLPSTSSVTTTVPAPGLLPIPVLGSISGSTGTGGAQQTTTTTINSLLP